MTEHINYSLEEAEMRAIHAAACAAVLRNGRTLTPDVDAFWPVYLQAAIRAAHASPLLADAARDVLIERRRQVPVERWTTAHDDALCPGDLALAGAAYALDSGWNLNPFSEPNLHNQPLFWPWPDEWWKPTAVRSSLVKSAALIIAAIERIDRAVCKDGIKTAPYAAAQLSCSKVTLPGEQEAIK